MKQRILRMALWLGVIGMAALIFLMSAQTGDVSTASSDSIVLPLLRLIRRVLSLSAEEADALYWTLQLIVRKAAHVGEYALLALLIRMLAASYGCRHAGILGWALAVAYAATDELHQSLVSARSAQFTDVLVDASGALLGVAAAWLAGRLRAAFHHSKEEP